MRNSDFLNRHLGQRLHTKVRAQVSVKENDLPGDWFPANGTLYDLVGTQLTRPVATQEHTVLSSVHTHLALGLGQREREGGAEAEPK